MARLVGGSLALGMGVKLRQVGLGRNGARP